MLIARTEPQLAASGGQQGMWEQAKAEGLLGEEFEQEWLTTDAPCPEICEPMNGQRRKLGEPFETGDGRMVGGPGEPHPGCLCTLVAVSAEERKAA